jgi:diacylglycerol O-acyltransferase / wax synthase
MPEGRRVGPVDTIWLHMDRPNNLMVIDAVMWFDEPVDWDRVTRTLSSRVLGRFPVFTQRPVHPRIPLGPPRWEDDPHFDLERHLVRARLPEPGDDATLQAYLEEQVHRPFDPLHPLWEYHYIDGYRSGCAIMGRFHHALADGAALSEVLLSITDATPVGDLVPPGRAERLHHDLLAPARTVPGTAKGLAGSAARSALNLFSGRRGVRGLNAVVDALHLVEQVGRVTGKLLLVDSPPSPLSGAPGPAKRVAWTGSRPLDDVKHVGRLAGATVNDVLVATVSDALARYQRSRGAEPVDLVTMIPVDLRTPGEPLPRELGNKFALVFLQMPSGEYAPLQRLALAKTRMDDIKRSPEAVITFGLITAIGCTNRDVERILIDFFSNKAIGVTTNVPGPQSRRYLAGVPLAGVLGWVPGSGRQALGVCIHTYNGSVRVGFKVDATIVPDPAKLVHAFDEALDELLRITGRRTGSRSLDPRDALTTPPAPFPASDHAPSDE